MKEKIKKFIINVLKEQGDRTLTGFHAFEEFNEMTNGNLVWTLKDRKGNNTNIVILHEVNYDCINAFEELERDGIIKIKPTSILVATYDGILYDYEIAESVRVYKKYRWIPILVEKGIAFENN